MNPNIAVKIVRFAHWDTLRIEQACARNVQFIAISGDSQRSHTHVAKFVSSLSTQIKPLFSQVLLTGDAQGLIALAEPELQHTMGMSPKFLTSSSPCAQSAFGAFEK